MWPLLPFSLLLASHHFSNLLAFSTNKKKIVFQNNYFFKEEFNNLIFSCVTTVIRLIFEDEITVAHEHIFKKMCWLTGACWTLANNRQVC